MHTLRTQLDYFQRLIPLLIDDYTVYAVDLPGMGWSEIQSAADYTEPEVRRRIVELLGHLSLNDLTLAGESLGATLALSVAAELGQQIRRVVALNPYDYPEGVERANLLASIIFKTMRIPTIGLAVAGLENELVLGGILRGGFYDPKKLPKDFVRELVRSGRRKGYAQVATAYVRAQRSFMDARKRYSLISVPVTLVYSDRDWSTASERKAVAQLLPNGRLLALANTGHFASLERPREVASILTGVSANP